MLTKEEIKKVLDGEIKVLYHKSFGEGEVQSVRIDKIENNREKATIIFEEGDLLETRKRPEFLFLDSPELSTTEWE